MEDREKNDLEAAVEMAQYFSQVFGKLVDAQKKKYFGLTAAMEAINTLLGDNKKITKMGGSRVIRHFLKDRLGKEYRNTPANIRMALAKYASGKIDFEVPYDDLITYAQEIELRTIDDRLQEICATHPMKAIEVGEHHLLVPEETLDNLQEYSQENIISARHYENETAQSHQERKYHLSSIQRFLTDLMKEHDEVVQEINNEGIFDSHATPRYMSAYVALSILTFLNETDSIDADLKKAETNMMIGETRQVGVTIFEIEYAFRQQVKKNPELGEVVDALHNEVMFETQRELEKHNCFLKPYFIIDKQPVLIEHTNKNTH